MLWQIPGSHIPYKGEKQPELYNNTAGQYVLSTAPDYFFGDTHLSADLGNIIAGPGTTTNSAVGNFAMSCGATAYNCAAGSDYRQYLLAYQRKPTTTVGSRATATLRRLRPTACSPFSGAAATPQA